MARYIDVSKRRDLIRRDGKVFCRRCEQHVDENGGGWRSLTMRNGVRVVQFICASCAQGRDAALRVKKCTHD